MIWIEVNYATQMGMRLQRFKVQRNSPFLAIFRCPYCGDSSKNKYKTRGYFYEKQGHVLFHCHNCGEHGGIRKMLKEHDSALYSQFTMDMFREVAGEQTVRRIPLPKVEFKSMIDRFAKRKIATLPQWKCLKTISQLEPGHKAREYVLARKIPASEHYRIYWAPKFYTWVNAQLPGKFPETMRNEGRIVFPMIDRYGDVFGFQGRSIDPKGDKNARYITIMLDEDKPRVFGFDVAKLDSEQLWVFEGAFDSMFFKNGLAQMGGENNSLDRLIDLNKCVFVLDNEPRSFDTCDRMLKLIEAGRRIVIWPDNVAQKDVNDMVLKEKMDAELIDQIMQRNTYYGAAAMLRLAAWRKVYQRS